MADRELAASLARQRESERGSYWKRNDSMRLVHLLVDPDLKPAFLAAESQGPGADAGSVRRFWERAAAKFNDDDWEPPHLFPTDPHLARSSAFTPAKRSKEVDHQYLRDKYRNLRKHFNNSVRRWNEMCGGKEDSTGAHQPVEAFWKCSGSTPGTHDEGCWYMFLVLWVNAHNDVLAVVLDKHRGGGQSSVGGGQAGGAHAGLSASASGRKKLRPGLVAVEAFDTAPELQLELKIESLFKQQTEALNFVCRCQANINEAADDHQKMFWRNNLATAQAQLAHIQSKLPSQPPPAPALLPGGQPPPPPPPGAPSFSSA